MNTEGNYMINKENYYGQTNLYKIFETYALTIKNKQLSKYQKIFK